MQILRHSELLLLVMTPASSSRRAGAPEPYVWDENEELLPHAYDLPAGYIPAGMMVRRATAAYAQNSDPTSAPKTESWEELLLSDVWKNKAPLEGSLREEARGSSCKIDEVIAQVREQKMHAVAVISVRGRSRTDYCRL